MKNTIIPNGYFLTASFRSYLNTTSARMTIIADLNGQIQILSHDLSLISDSTADQILIVSAGGLRLLHVSVSLISDITNNGFCHCVLSLNKGSGATTQRLAVLANGYITNSQSCSWPDTDSNSIDSCYHALSSYSNTPAVGEPAVFICPEGLSCYLHTFVAPIDCSDTVVDRYPFCRVLDDTPDIIAYSSTSMPFVANDVKSLYGLNTGSLYPQVAADSSLLIPGVWINSGYRYEIGLNPIHGLDDFGTVEWFLEFRVLL